MMHPIHMHEPTKLVPFDIEEQWLNSEPLLNNRAPHPIPKGGSQPLKGTHFRCLYLRPHSFG